MQHIFLHLKLLHSIRAGAHWRGSQEIMLFQFTDKRDLTPLIVVHVRHCLFLFNASTISKNLKTQKPTLYVCWFGFVENKSNRGEHFGIFVEFQVKNGSITEAVSCYFWLTLT